MERADIKDCTNNTFDIFWSRHEHCKNLVTEKISFCTTIEENITRKWAPSQFS